MPKVSASNGIRPEIRALEVFPLGATVTPDVINDHVGTGEYAAKYVSFLNTRYGFNITANKDGRRVVSYTMVAEPANAAVLRSSTAATKIVIYRENGQILAKVDGTKSVKAPKAPKAKVAKAPKTKVAKALGLTMAEANEIREEVAAERALEIKAKNLETLRQVAKDMGMKKVAAKKPKASKKTRDYDDVTEQFGTSGEVGTSFSVEKDWDSIEGMDLSKLI
jgi:hypothetical protein